MSGKTKTRTKAPARGSADQRLAVEVGKRGLVVCQGGPLDARWYFADDLAALARCEAYFDRPWHYSESSAYQPHPTITNAAGRVHVYTGRTVR